LSTRKLPLAAPSCPFDLTLFLQNDLDSLCDNFLRINLRQEKNKLCYIGVKVKKTIVKETSSVIPHIEVSSASQAATSFSSASSSRIRHHSSSDNPKSKLLLRKKVVVCVYGARCSRPDCTYFHASPAANFVAPNCLLIRKPCKFGALCQRARCVFCHPSPAAAS
jgi:hypothetical protein